MSDFAFVGVLDGDWVAVAWEDGKIVGFPRAVTEAESWLAERDWVPVTPEGPYVKPDTAQAFAVAAYHVLVEVEPVGDLPDMGVGASAGNGEVKAGFRPDQLRDEEGRWATAHFGGIFPESAEEFGSIFDGFSHGNLTARAHSFNGAGNIWSVGGQIYTKDSPRSYQDGVNVGTWERGIEQRADGEIVVTHDFLDISPHVRGQGFASAFNAHAEEEYRKLGVDHIELNATQVGQYAWARQGFRFRDERMRRAYLGLLRLRLPRMRESAVAEHVPEETFRELLRRTDPAQLDAWRSESEIAAFDREHTWQDKEGGGEMWAGKYALLIGGSWLGRKDLVEAKAYDPDRERVCSEVFDEWVAERQEGDPVLDGVHWDDTPEFWDRVEERLGQKRFNPDQPRVPSGEHGGEWAKVGLPGFMTDPIPDAPGTVPIPDDHVRLYHYSLGPAQQLREQGLLMGRAHGESYQEPNRVWAAAGKFPESASRSGKNVVEFHVPIEDERWDIGKYMSTIHYGEGGVTGHAAFRDYLGARGAHVTFMGDIRPDEIIAVHEPWHETYRYLGEQSEKYREEMIPDLAANALDPPYSIGVDGAMAVMRYMHDQGMEIPREKIDALAETHEKLYLKSAKDWRTQLRDPGGEGGGQWISSLSSTLDMLESLHLDLAGAKRLGGGTANKVYRVGPAVVKARTGLSHRKLRDHIPPGTDIEREMAAFGVARVMHDTDEFFAPDTPAAVRRDVSVTTEQFDPEIIPAGGDLPFSLVDTVVVSMRNRGLVRHVRDEEAPEGWGDMTIDYWALTGEGVATDPQDLAVIERHTRDALMDVDQEEGLDVHSLWLRMRERLLVERTEEVPAIVTEFIKGDIPAETYSKLRHYVGTPRRGVYRISERQLRNAALFDSLIGNLDRHGGNMIITDDEPTRLMLIDNGLAFPSVNDPHADGNWEVVKAVESGTGDLELQDDEVEFLEKLDADFPRLSAAVGDLPRGSVDAMRERLHWMIENRRFYEDRDVVAEREEQLLAEQENPEDLV